MRVFVSHASKDKPRVLKLARAATFIELWVDHRELLEGEFLDPVIRSAINDSHVFLVFISEHSIRPECWVRKELDWALEKEGRLDRSFVLPVICDAGIDLTACAAPFDGLANRKFVEAFERTPAGLVKARERIAGTLFHWASDWLDRHEPKGDDHLAYVGRLEASLTEYQRCLFNVKAALDWSIPTLSKPKALAHLNSVSEQYGAVARLLMPSLAGHEAEIRWRFGYAAHNAFKVLAGFIRQDVYHGAAFDLNDVLKSLTMYDTELKGRPAAIATAEKRRKECLAKLEPVMHELVRRTTDFIRLLKP